VIDYILHGCTNYGIRNEKRIADINFADDISLLETDQQKLDSSWMLLKEMHYGLVSR